MVRKLPLSVLYSKVLPFCRNHNAYLNNLESYVSINTHRDLS